MHAMACRDVECRPVLLSTTHHLSYASHRANPPPSRGHNPSLCARIRARRNAAAPYSARTPQSTAPEQLVSTEHKGRCDGDDPWRERARTHAARPPCGPGGGRQHRGQGSNPRRVRRATRGLTHRDGDALLLVDDAGRIAARGVPQVQAPVRVHALHLPRTPPPIHTHARSCGPHASPSPCCHKPAPPPLPRAAPSCSSPPRIAAAVPRAAGGRGGKGRVGAGLTWALRKRGRRWKRAQTGMPRARRAGEGGVGQEAGQARTSGCGLTRASAHSYPRAGADPGPAGLAPRGPPRQCPSSRSESLRVTPSHTESYIATHKSRRTTPSQRSGSVGPIIEHPRTARVLRLTLCRVREPQPLFPQCLGQHVNHRALPTARGGP
jgi:hypothetical protein